MSQPESLLPITASIPEMIELAKWTTAQPGRVRAPRGLGEVLVNRMVDTLRHGYGTDDCLTWPLGKKEGYGVVNIGGLGQVRVHRYVFASLHPLLREEVLDHLCRNRACFNPRHLEPVTHAVNIARGEGVAPRKAAQTHCVHGHEFTPENTIARSGRSGRACRACQRESGRRYGKEGRGR